MHRDVGKEQEPVFQGPMPERKAHCSGGLEEHVPAHHTPP